MRVKAAGRSLSGINLRFILTGGEVADVYPQLSTLSSFSRPVTGPPTPALSVKNWQ